MLPEILKLRSTFTQYFEIVPAFSDALKDEVRVTVIATGFGPERYRRRRREERPAEHGVGPRERSAPSAEEGAFEVPDDVLEVPSFLRD